MKNNIAILAALAIATPSFADTTIRMTGSTAFRAQTHTAIVTASPGGLGFTQTAFTGSSASGAKYAIYSLGTSPNKTTIKTSWAGSVGGVKSVAQQRTDLPYLPDSASGGSLAESAATETGVGTAPDIGFSDCAQSSTNFRTPTLSNKVAGIVQFRWVTNFGSPITSINSQQARALFQGGSLPLSQFTGNPADATKNVYGVGRDPDSGTRVICLAETGIGALSTVVHWQPAFSGTNVSTLIPWPEQTVFGDTFAEGNGGYPSGGDLIRAMRYSSTAVSVAGGPAEECYFVAFVGVNDVSTGLAAHNPPTTVGAGPAKVITFENADGGALSTVSSATAVADLIKNGTHPAWSYLNVFHNGLTGDKLTLYNDFTTLLKASVSNNISLSQMKVKRNSDGGTILPGTRLD